MAKKMISNTFMDVINTPIILFRMLSPFSFKYYFLKYSKERALNKQTSIFHQTLKDKKYSMQFDLFILYTQQNAAFKSMLYFDECKYFEEQGKKCFALHYCVINVKNDNMQKQKG